MIITESYNVLTPASESVLTMEEARLQLRLDDDGYEDSLIQSICKAADALAENRTSRAFMQSTHEYSANSWPCYTNEIRLWPGNLVRVNSVKYYDSNNVLQTLVADTDYQVNSRSKPGRIIMLETPSLYDRPDAVIVEYIAGYGAYEANADAQREAIPEDVKIWMKLNVATLWANRQLFTDEKIGSIQTYADHFIYPYIL